MVRAHTCLIADCNGHQQLYGLMKNHHLEYARSLHMTEYERTWSFKLRSLVLQSTVQSAVPYAVPNAVPNAVPSTMPSAVPSAVLIKGADIWPGGSFRPKSWWSGFSFDPSCDFLDQLCSKQFWRNFKFHSNFWNKFCKNIFLTQLRSVWS